MLKAPSDLVDALEQTWASTADVCRSLSDLEWERETGCPGWTVKDNLSHLVGLELVMMGGDEPDHAVPEGLAHVNGPFGAYMEAHVHVRRPVPDERREGELRAAGAPVGGDRQDPHGFGSPVGASTPVPSPPCGRSARRATEPGSLRLTMPARNSTSRGLMARSTA